MKQEVVSLLSSIFKKMKIEVSQQEIESKLEIPPSSDLGDYAFPCFFLASKLKQAPHEIALKIREEIGNPSSDFEDVQTQGPYINFFLNKVSLAKELLKEAIKENTIKKSSGKIMIEFSQANTHKAFHVGHIRGTSIGESLARISEFLGKKVIRANYQGDNGMHVAKWIWCYKKYHSREKIKKDESWFASIYVDAVKRLGKSKKLQEEVDEINKKLDDKNDLKLNKLWKDTRTICLQSLERVYKELNTKFDAYYFESEMEEKSKEIVKDLLARKIAEISDEATIIKLDKYGLGVWVLLRKDGTVLYSAKDLYLMEKKFKDFPDLEKCINIVADEQNLHFLQLIKTLELMNSLYTSKFKHLPFGLVRLPTGKMSSRTGDNILYSDFIKEVSEYAAKRIKERTKSLTKKDLEKRALAVSIAAIKFAMLRQGLNKVIVFSKEDALNFEGDTGPYLLYSYARASSILKKSKVKPSFETSKAEQKELELAKKISEFNSVVLHAFNSLSPSLIANYSFQLAQTFNEFYHTCPVIGSEQESFRLSLVQAFSKTLKTSLNLLGIDVLEEM